jgi:hypothetical protein
VLSVCCRQLRIVVCTQANSINFLELLPAMTDDLNSTVRSQRVACKAAQAVVSAVQLVTSTLGAAEAALFRTWAITEWAEYLGDFNEQSSSLSAVVRCVHMCWVLSIAIAMQRSHLCTVGPAVLHLVLVLGLAGP